MTGPRRASHLRGRYLAHSPWLAAYLGATDAVLSGVHMFARRSAPQPGRIQRILIAVGGHLGDAIIATSTIELIRRARPDAELGLLTPSWCVPVFADDSRFAWKHTVDHWRLNRSPGGAGAKIRRYRQSAANAIDELRGIGYDAAFDLYPYYPNMAGVLRESGIPIRAGFVTGGRGSYYTHPLAWVDDRVHVAEKQARLVRSVLTDVAVDTPLPSAIPTLSDAKGRDLRGVGTRFAILHPGAGVHTKDWPIERWQTLARELASRGVSVVFTGAGDAECRRCDALAKEIPGSMSLAGTLDWAGLTRLVEAASVVVSGDTSVAHLAAALRTPNVVLYSGINPISEWRPLNHPDVPMSTLTEDVPCAPCFRGCGCPTMECVRGIAVERVVAEIDRVLRA